MCGSLFTNDLFVKNISEDAHKLQIKRDEDVIPFVAELSGSALPVPSLQCESLRRKRWELPMFA